MKIYPILICLTVIIIINCAKERSCERCQPDLLPTPPRTTPNELITRCSVYVADENKARIIYVETTTKYQPQTYKIFDSLVMDGRKLYDTTFRIENYFDMTRFIIGDSFNYRTEVRNKFSQADYFNDSTLIY